ncbi:NlpC/P60 family protein [Nicoliella spurrieriana]|uniref:NlpC/P60 family protein n=1 Tax=Nicoliella spurrieriana TaxID=2925830 RepID=A0A976RSS5_9LACO|nr:NlpC/P60 family protein [Nicoliella spurrieriana]UQS87143.1 NlpC/P60 family protein [Nicoliella spurrieriana]
MNNHLKKTFVSIATAFTLFTAGASLTAAKPAHAASDEDATTLIDEANTHMNARYVWGANGPSSFDCSGFTKYVYKKALGVNLPRTAQAQYNSNQKVSVSNLKKGDLVFFGSSSRSISHVGMYIGNGKMIDAQNRGVIKENIHSAWWNLVGAARVGE